MVNAKPQKELPLAANGEIGSRAWVGRGRKLQLTLYGPLVPPPPFTVPLSITLNWRKVLPSLGRHPRLPPNDRVQTKTDRRHFPG